MIVGRVKGETHPGIPPADEAGYGAGHPGHRHITDGRDGNAPRIPTSQSTYPGAAQSTHRRRLQPGASAPTPDQMKPPSQKRPPCFSQKTTLNCGWVGAGAGGPPKNLKKIENTKKILILTGLGNDHLTINGRNPPGASHPQTELRAPEGTGHPGHHHITDGRDSNTPRLPTSQSPIPRRGAVNPPPPPPTWHLCADA